MASDYIAIRKENIRKYGEETRHLAFLGRLYSERTHFVYELLQNAEDKDATHIQIILYRDRLELLHDGTPFDEADIRGICGVGEGTKSEDLTKIGKFGIGFKSVYAYTSSPEIHCGDEHFCIKHYVRPYGIVTAQVSTPWTTKFVFPFDTSPVSADVAFDEIAERLSSLNVRTLLFLRNIGEINWQTDEGESGIYLRGDPSPRAASRQVTVIGQSKGEEAEEESWLVFERPVNDPNGNSIKPVEIAYRLEQAQEGKREREETIIPLHNSPLICFFATEKDTRLGFLIQGPYKTTPARDNIPKDDSWNTHLLEVTAALVVDSLRHLKSMKLLSVSVLEAMPIQDEGFPPKSMFRGIYDAVAEALTDEEFLPAEAGGFSSARRAKIGRGAEIRGLLSSAQLAELSERPESADASAITEAQWLSGAITKEQTPALRRYLTQQLGIEEVTPESFARHVTDGFFQKQSDEWFVELYKFLLKHEALWRASRSQWVSDGQMRHKPFVRLEDGSQVSAFEDDGSVAVFLPHQGARQLPKFPTVKPVLVEDKEAAEFFKKLDVNEPNVVAVVLLHVLPLYESDCVDVSDEDNHDEHVNLIIQVLQEDSKEHQKLTERLRKTAFIFGRNAGTDEEVLVTPQELYVRSEGLSVFLKGNPGAWFLDKRYGEEEIKAFLTLGLKKNPRIQKKEPDRWDRKKHVTIEKWHGCHERGLDGFDPGCCVDHLEFAVQSPTTERSRFIWNEIAIPLKYQIRGSVEKSTRKTYEESDKKQVVSTLGKQLLSKAWLPDDSGGFHKPSDISLTDLPEEFDRDEDLAGQLGMKGGGELEALAKRSGVDIDDINLMKKFKDNSPEQFEKIKKIMRGNEGGKSSFPERSSANVERRREHAKRDAKEAPGKEYEKRLQSVRISAASGDKSTYLKESYTNGEGQLVCQMCDGKMPFRKRDGEYYFESVQVFNNLSHEHTAAYLALCPVCAAKYKEFVKGDDDNATALRAGISISSLDKLAIPIKLGQQDGSIRFVETHLSDIQEILKIEK